MEELSNLAFVKENSQKLMERKVSFEKRDRKIVSLHIISMLFTYIGI